MSEIRLGKMHFYHANALCYVGKVGLRHPGVHVGVDVPHSLHGGRVRVLHLFLRLKLLSRRGPQEVQPGDNLLAAIIVQGLPVSLAVH